MILLEHGPEGRPVLFAAPREVIVAETAADVAPALARLDAARAAGAWVAGYLSYEAGYALEPKLAALMPEGRAHPLLAFGVYDAPQAAEAVLAQARAEAAGVSLAPLRPMVSRAEYDAAFARVAEYIAAGDCYQINLTFPMETALSGSALGLYGALRARQAVGFGACLDLGVGPVLVSRSPELFFRCTAGGRIEARPMKGTAPRGADPEEDAALAEELYRSEKGRAENLMIVDLMRNDLSRVAEPGSVSVAALFEVESHPTVHHLVSTVAGLARAGIGPAELLEATFPPGSITGAPKHQAMKVIARHEPPRGPWCGSLFHIEDDGRLTASVLIRTASFERMEGRWRFRTLAGAGIVADSDPTAELAETDAKIRALREALTGL